MSLLIDLNWLSVQKRIRYKINRLIYKAVNGPGPATKFTGATQILYQ